MLDHFDEAEKCLRASGSPSLSDTGRDRYVARAHVHALLAAIQHSTNQADGSAT